MRHLRRYTLFWLALLMGGALWARPTALSAQTAPQLATVLYERAACRFPIPDGYAVECGYLTVPQNRDYPQGRTVRLHVAHFHSPNPAAPDDPILYLVGGPGVSLLYDIASLFYHFEGYLANRDVIVYDQRGTGYSVPALRCEGITNEDADTAYRHCLDFYADWGTDLEAFSSVESAADAEDLRVALGFAQWNVVGVSYGSRLALVVARDHPQGIRSLIVDSVAPLGPVDYSRFATQRGWIDQILRDCAADLACGAAYPAGVSTFTDLLRAYERTQSVQVDERRVQINADVIETRAFALAQSHAGAQALPAAIAAAAAGDWEPLLTYPGHAFTTFDLMHSAINCNDGTNAWFGCGAQLGIQPGPALTNRPLDFDMPILILNGKWDPLTPTENAKAVWRDLPHAIFAEFPYLSHGIVRSGDACAVGLAFAFLDDPTAALDVSCALATQPSFVLP